MRYITQFLTYLFRMEVLSTNKKEEGSVSKNVTKLHDINEPQIRTYY